MADPTSSVQDVVVAARKPPPPGGVRIFEPRISVVLLKNIGRSSAGGSIGVSTRFSGTERSIDLTPYLGDQGSVMTSRSTRQPAGMWSVTFSDQIATTQQESLYGLIEPQDVVEIRMARDVSRYAGKETLSMPVVMRGFVSTIRRHTAMTSTGPRRMVTISGQDYGKVLEIFRIIYLPGYVVGQDLLTVYNLYLNYGVGAKPNQSAADFVQSVIDQAITPFLQKMIASSGYSGPARSPIQLIQTDISVTTGIVSPFGIQGWDGGTAYELMSHFGDVGPWNELFIEDRSDGPYLVFRPNPFMDLTGAMIQGGSAPVAHDIRDDEIIDLDIGRSDSNVSNYYWVGAPRMDTLQPDMAQLSAQGRTPPPYVSDYPNCSPAFYGNRLMRSDSQQGPRFDGQSSDDYTKGAQDLMGFLDQRRDALIRQNRDNVVLEDGTVTFRGNERITAGSYVNLVRGPSAAGGIEAKYYAHTVAQTYTPMRSFMTTAYLDRGMGFVSRIQRGSGTDSPYLAELNLSGAYKDG